jgi:hypothetical protein
MLLLLRFTERKFKKREISTGLTFVESNSIFDFTRVKNGFKLKY